MVVAAAGNYGVALDGSPILGGITSPGNSQFAITVGAFGNAGGRILSGWISDSLGRIRTLQTMIFISAVAMPILFFVQHQVVPFYILVAVVYWCYGTQLSVYASTSADFYGTKNVGFNYGLLLLAWGVAAIFGPFLGGRVFVATGEYRYAFFVAAALELSVERAGLLHQVA